MEIGLIVISVIGLILLVVLFIEAREYNRHTKVVANYIEAAQQFIVAFETTKGALNHNADIQKSVMDKTIVLEKAMEVVFTLLDLHDKALGQKTAANLKRILDEPFLPLKKLED
jgi:hypothetical protein